MEKWQYDEEAFYEGWNETEKDENEGDGATSYDKDSSEWGEVEL